MTLSFWRYTHLALALFSSIFLLLASVTGIILAVDAVQEKTLPYKAANFDKITLGETLPVLKKEYSEITELSVDYNQFVTLQAIDADGNDINAYIDPKTGKALGKPEKKSEFIQWVTGFHRSLFLHETGRFFVGVISFCLLLISISGFVLVLKRQRGIRNFFSKVIKEYFAQYYHVVLGRLALIPIFIIALTGTYLSLERFNFFMGEEKAKPVKTELSAEAKKTSIFKTILLSDVKKIEFPFTDDPEEYYIIELKDRKIEVNQADGTLISEKRSPFTVQLSALSLDLHTGRINGIWAVILAIACINILFFIYSGFAITLKRRSSLIKNKFKANESKYILLVGSENGSSFRFANAILKQLIGHGKKAFIAELNSFSVYPKAEHIIVFSSTHGLGDAPSNGTKFKALLQKQNQEQKIKFSVVGFGSKSYPDFCQFAIEIDQFLETQSWAERFLDLQTVNDKSAIEFVEWIKLWSAKAEIPLVTTPSLYNHIPKGLQKLMVLDKTPISDTEHTFILTLRANSRTKFASGDLLAIYPANDSRERLYSIGNHSGNVQLVVKLHPNGLGSGFLNNLEIGDTIKARIINNKVFHFPNKAPKVAFISNGTGIAPFLGMIEQNKTKKEIHLYSGFRMETPTLQAYKKFAGIMIQKEYLDNFHVALSREAEHIYVMDLIKRDTAFFIDLLKQGGVIMICGSLAMQKDVETILDELCLANGTKSLLEYKENGQLLTDCY
ncbi:sulfite reductase (NADPH) flavoprotein alpha-component [Flavobacterium sp. CF108]|uniref:PepSY domain-containing protein n=1 Tax=unclassified Flavobacterium TaxID=196869 RepID=UPI0008C92A85|nr:MULTISPECIES: PepSY domain-containing protein [unclassified Flavobacterium]SEO67472.1 sulfite reductase (NADPH) flavoprotein alpha-component [Flavobacterium sp. fv08]SHH89327.1 sulfite reductase (NADPH) flavoprotein alpha-component [Flavobacterium sp. CF108]